MRRIECLIEEKLFLTLIEHAKMRDVPKEALATELLKRAISDLVPPGLEGKWNNHWPS